ncbi:hypothetical protein GCK32_008402, partial [Trichostrongylus colubriformis]
RSGTPAAKMKKIDTVEARRRTAAMSALFREYSRYTPERIGEEHDVLVCEMATDGVHAVGHNKCYEHFLVPYYDGIMGSWVRVRVVEVAKFHMRSELCKKAKESPELVLTDWTAKNLENCEPIGTFKPADENPVIRATSPIEKSPIAVIVLSVPLLIGMILWYFIGI